MQSNQFFTFYKAIGAGRALPIIDAEAVRRLQLSMSLPILLSSSKHEKSSLAVVLSAKPRLHRVIDEEGRGRKAAGKRQESMEKVWPGFRRWTDSCLLAALGIYAYISSAASWSRVSNKDQGESRKDLERRISYHDF